MQFIVCFYCMYGRQIVFIAVLGLVCSLVWQFKALVTLPPIFKFLFLVCSYILYRLYTQYKLRYLYYYVTICHGIVTSY